MKIDAQSRARALDILTPFLVIGIFGGIFILSYLYYFQNEIERYLPGGAAHEQTIAFELSERQKYLKDIQRLNSLFQEIAANPQDPVSLILPQDMDAAALFANYGERAGNLGMGLQYVSVTADEKTKGPVREIVLSMRLTNASYERMKRFLADLESDARLIDITAIDFDPGSQSLALSGKVYYGGAAWKPKEQPKNALKGPASQ